jgi:hypothetical protein
VSEAASTLSVRLIRNLFLRLQYWAATPTDERSSWTAQISRGTRPVDRQQLSLSYSERAPRFCDIGDKFGEPKLWVGSAAFAVPPADRERVAEWIAATQKLNTADGAASSVVLPDVAA